MLITILAGLVAFALIAGGLITHIYTCNYTRQGEALAMNISLTGDSEHNISEAWTSAPTDVVIAMSATIAKMRGLYILATQDCTIETNANPPAGSGNTLTLKANKPLQWYKDCGQANPLTFNVTTAFLTSIAVTGSIEIRVLMDSTL